MIEEPTASSHSAVKAIVHEEIGVAFLRVRYWIVVSVLANVLTIGAPALVAGAIYYSQVQATNHIAQENQARLNSRTRFIENTDRRIVGIEKFLHDEHGYDKPQELPEYR